MLLGKPLTTKWEESVGMLAECKILKAEVLQPAELHVLLQDPLSQKFVLRVMGAAGVGLTGNLIALNVGLTITCHETA